MPPAQTSPEAKRMGRPRLAKPARDSRLALMIDTYLRGGGTIVDLEDRTGVSRNTLQRWYTQGESRELKKLQAALTVLELLNRGRSVRHRAAPALRVPDSEPELLNP